MAELSKVGRGEVVLICRTRLSGICVAITKQHPNIAVQVAATRSSLTFYTPEDVLSLARQARAEAAILDDADDESPAKTGRERFGIVDVDVDVWTDEEEWGVSGRLGRVTSLRDRAILTI